ncbi:MAG TPA: GH1 family beta-glucosidase, partial [Candidatus Sulfotelmatobacter sp.]|nr:GH1 family beta-glucosidase [Candidatus Sulfotelmatobacter sp.]
MNARSPFPRGFLWGAATSSYQIEGSPLADGAGPGIWHRFSHTPGRTLNGWTGDVACDHYRRWRDDVALMHALGLDAYRFSLAWTRLLPEGTGRANRRGLDFYSRLVDALLEAGIRPMATLFHWDLPAALDDRGGWLNPDSPKWFGELSALAFKTLGDRVGLWCTVNEPWVIVDAGYLYGVNAPGHRNLYEAPIAAHHLLLAHGEAVRACRAAGTGKIGLVVNLEPKEPASERPEDVNATRLADAYMNRLYLDPVYLGRYPEEMRELFGAAWPEWPSEDFAKLGEPFDFLGINWYTRALTRYEPSLAPICAARVVPAGATVMETGWEVHAPSLLTTLSWVRDRYGNPPIYVTENGGAFADPAVASGGRISDPLRLRYLREHLAVVRQAIDAGVDVRGYFVWSLLDNFEWPSGYSKRFGIVHVNFETQQRTIKDSGWFYR